MIKVCMILKKELLFANYSWDYWGVEAAAPSSPGCYGPG
jgi:hypothetical protein